MVAKKVLLAAAALLPTALAQSGPYGQCGGQNWTGPTTCTPGWTCVFSNPYYSQCLQAASTTTARTTTTSTRSSSSSTRPSSSSTRPSSSSSIRPSSSSTRTTSSTRVSSMTSAPPASTTVAATGNPFASVSLYANPYYASEISTLAIPSLSGPLATKAAAVAKIPTFVWLDTYSKIPLLDSFLGNIRALNRAGASPPVAATFVVYDLPDRDCAAAASNGEYSLANNGAANYRAYIDAIRAILVTYSDVKTILCIEPDSLANLVTNLNVPKCAGAASAYRELTSYALSRLNLPNVSMYLDAGHAGWLGWPANIGPAAELFGQVYRAAGSPASVRGLATNVANYNAWTSTSCPAYTSPNANCDEQKYINALAPLLTAQGFPAHFIVDTGRNGVQPTKQLAWGDWCNVIGTGFGIRPSTNTGNAYTDSFVWIKPGGECDGTSNSSAPRYDYHCGFADALQPAPQAGQWFQAYFEQLLTNANPAF